MSINLSAYDTTSMAGWQVKPILDHLANAGVAADGKVEVTTGQHDEAFPLVLVQGGSSFSDAVPRFTHPLPMINHLGGDKHPTIMALDVREFGRWDSPSHSFRVRDAVQYAWALRRAVLNQIWLDGRVDTLRDLSSLPAETYAALVSDCIARKFSLNAHERMTVAVLAAYFYYGLYTDAEEFSDAEKPFLIGKITQFTHVPAAQVFELLDKMPVIHGLPKLIEVILERVPNVALENLNIGTFLAQLTGLWWGTGSREVMGAALEHIPTWLSIIAASFSQSVFKRSPVAKMAQNFDRGGKGLAFTRSLEVLMGGPNAVQIPNRGTDIIYQTYFHA